MSVAKLPSARKNDKVASASLRKALIGKMSFAGHRPDVPGYADKLVGEDRDEMISEYVAARQASGDSRPMQEIAVEYNDKVIYPDKVRLNCYYYRHYLQMIVCTVLGRKM